MDIIEIDEQKLVVTQANALARSVQQMTLQEKRLLLLAISYIHQSDQNLYRIPITAIQDYLNIETKAIYKRIQEITDKLMTRVLHIDDEDGNWEKFQWVSYCKYFSKEKSEIGKACIEIQIHEHLRPMLLNLRKHFGSVPLLQIAPMPSVNSIRVFEILWFTSMKLIKTQLSFWVYDFKKRLDLENKYYKFKDFRKDVLVRAQRDCASYSPLTFTWEEEKKGRKIVRLHFSLQGNEKYKEPPAPRTEPLQHNATFEEVPSNYRLLEEQGISDEKIQELIAHHGTDVISNNIRLIRQKHEAGKVPDGKISLWTIKAIQEDWHGQKKTF
jgi:plasmid replication initiation protein